MTTGKTIALTRPTFVGKVMSLLFNTLSRLVITFLPSSQLYFSLKVYPMGLHACMHAQSLSHVQLFVTCQAPLSMGYSRQECWSGLPFPPPGNIFDTGIEPTSPLLSGRFFTTEPPGKPPVVLDSSYSRHVIIPEIYHLLKPLRIIEWFELTLLG